MSDRELVDKMERVWQSIAQLCASLDEGQWRLPTDCPGWSVQDQLSHLVGSESRLLGLPAPDHTPANTDHIRNDSGLRNEVVVDWRRSWPGARVLEEFREVTTQRLAALRAMTEADFDADTQTPIGPGKVRDLIQIRVYDAWVHEQDMRRAVGQPGHLTGPVAEHAVGRTALAMPYVVGRKVQPPDGTTVVFQVSGEAGDTLPVEMRDSRGHRLDGVPEAPTVRLDMDVETFICLGCGRWDPAAALESGKINIQGDRALGETVVAQMNIMI
jgi:uncharacterized protein (TIGR03083 family)